MNLVEVIVGSTAGQPTTTKPVKKITGTELIDNVKNIKLTKSSAVQILALDAALSKVVDDAKKYLLELQSASSGSFTDPQTGLIMQASEFKRVTITNSRIETLKADIKKEEDLIKKSIREGIIKRDTYFRWSLVK